MSILGIRFHPRCSNLFPCVKKIYFDGSATALLNLLLESIMSISNTKYLNKSKIDMLLNDKLLVEYLFVLRLIILLLN